MKKIVLSIVLASVGIVSSASADENNNEAMYKYSYQYQEKQEAQAKHQYQHQKQEAYERKNAFKGTNPNMGSMGGTGMRIKSGGRH